MEAESDSSESDPPAPPGTEYVVERILGERKRENKKRSHQKKRVEYHVKWEGCVGKVGRSSAKLAYVPPSPYDGPLGTRPGMRRPHGSPSSTCRTALRSSSTSPPRGRAGAEVAAARPEAAAARAEAAAARAAAEVRVPSPPPRRARPRLPPRRRLASASASAPAATRWYSACASRKRRCAATVRAAARCPPPVCASRAPPATSMRARPALGLRAPSLRPRRIRAERRGTNVEQRPPPPMPPPPIPPPPMPPPPMPPPPMPPPPTARR